MALARGSGGLGEGKTGVTWWGSRSCPSRASGRTGGPGPGYAMALARGSGGLGRASFESLRTNGGARICNGVGGREWWFGGGGKQVRHGGGAVPVLREPQDERAAQAQAMRWPWRAGVVGWGERPSRASGRTGGPGYAMVLVGGNGGLGEGGNR